MDQRAGFAILLFVALLLIVSSVSVKVTAAQGNDNSSEKSSTAAKTCSPEVFKGNPGLYATCVALAHNKESAASAEKPASEKPLENLNLFKKETGTIISAPIEVKKGPTIEEEKKASADECPAGQAKDWAGICFPLKECKASISAQPGTCQSEVEKTTGVLTGELHTKKPAISSNPVSENCLQTTTSSAKSLCLTKGTLTPATTTQSPTNKEAEKPVACKGPAGMLTNGINSLYTGTEIVNGKCVPVIGAEVKANAERKPEQGFLNVLTGKAPPATKSGQGFLNLLTGKAPPGEGVQTSIGWVEVPILPKKGEYGDCIGRNNWYDEKSSNAAKSRVCSSIGVFLPHGTHGMTQEDVRKIELAAEKKQTQ